VGVSVDVDDSLVISVDMTAGPPASVGAAIVGRMGSAVPAADAEHESEESKTGSSLEEPVEACLVACALRRRVSSIALPPMAIPRRGQAEPTVRLIGESVSRSWSQRDSAHRFLVHELLRLRPLRRRWPTLRRVVKVQARANYVRVSRLKSFFVSRRVV
jgi:hypothetical protein